MNGENGQYSATCPGYTKSQHDGFVSSYTSLLLRRNEIVDQENACAALRGIVSRAKALLEEASSGAEDAFSGLQQVDLQLIAEQSSNIEDIKGDISSKTTILNSSWAKLGESITTLDKKRENLETAMKKFWTNIEKGYYEKHDTETSSETGIY